MGVLIASMNLERGGLDADGDRRWHDALDFLRAKQLGALLLQEAKWWGEEESRFGRMADALGMQFRATSKQGLGNTGHRLVTFYHPDIFEPVAESERGMPFWHARLSLTLWPKGKNVEPFKLVHRHASPFDPTQRLSEARYDVGFAGKLALLGGDWNCIAPGDPELVWDGWRDWKPPQRAELEYQALKDARGGFALRRRKPVADRHPAQMLIDNGLLDVGAKFGDRRPTAGLDYGKTGPRRIDRFHADESLLIGGIVMGYGYLGDPYHALTFTDHVPIYTELDLDRLPTYRAAAAR